MDPDHSFREDLSALVRRDAVKRCTTQICVVGEELANDERLNELLAMHFKLKVVYSEKDGREYTDSDMVFLVRSFESSEFTVLREANKRILGPGVIYAFASRGHEIIPFPRENRPLFSYSMKDVRMCASGTNNDESRKLVDLIHFMGGSARRDLSNTPNEYLVAKAARGSKYRDAVRFNLPIMNIEWVYASWKRRNEVDFRATEKSFMDEHRLKPFEGLRLCFIGFNHDDKVEMAEVTTRNKGHVVLHHREATHAVFETIVGMDRDRLKGRVDDSSKAFNVTKQWFWTSVDRGVCMDEEAFPAFEQTQVKLQPRENRKRQAASPGADDGVPAANRRNMSKTSIDNLESSNNSALPEHLFSTDDLEKLTISPRRVDKRRMLCLEMLETEENYLRALNLMANEFKTPLEERNADPANEVLTKSEMAQIFGKIPPLIQVHSNIARNLRTLIRHNWRNDNLIGKMWADHHNDLQKVYPPFINSYDTAKQMLDDCDAMKPRFHNFLKAVESRPECARNTLRDLLIRPVQRLPSVILLLKELAKRTEKSNPDYAYITHAIGYVEQVVSLSNESRRQTDNYARLLELLNEIDGLPADFVSSSRAIISQVEMNVLATGGNWTDLKGRTICFIAFNDFVVLAKVRTGVQNLNLTQKTNKNLTLSRNISFIDSLKFRSEKKKYKYSRLCYFSMFRKIERVTARGAHGTIYVVTLRDNIGGDEPLIVQPGGDYTTDSLDYFMNTLCKHAGMMASRELPIETIDDEYFATSLQTSYPETYQLLLKAMGNMTESSKDGTLRRSSTFKRAVSSVSLSLSRISKFSSRSNLHNMSERS
uniref:Protein ECT2 n=1 Tax=Steinernema glaseri TaxID=37863 RepID=A0A1I7Y217_9BILA